MKREKLVSIIMPVYNSENYLSKAIESVLNQKYKNLELLAVNDGSTDNSLKILKEFEKKDNRLRILSKKNGGISSARNYGLKYANGEYVCFIDNDDEYDSNLLLDNIKLIDEENTDILKFNKIKKVISYTKVREESAIFDFEKMILHEDEIFKNFNYIYKFGGTIWNAIYRKSFLIENNILFDETNRNVIEDHRFNLECYKHLNSIILVSKPYYYWNMRIFHSTTGKFNKERFEEIKIEANNLYKFLMNKKIDELNPHFWSLVKFSCLYNIMLVINYKNSKFNFSKTKKYLKNLKNLEIFKRKLNKEDYKYIKENNKKTKYLIMKIFLKLFDCNLYFLFILICKIKLTLDIKFKNKRF